MSEPRRIGTALPHTRANHPGMLNIDMNQQLREVLERADTWPIQAQEELRRVALSIERALQTGATSPQRPSLRDVMLAATLAGIDFDRNSVYPHVRDVEA